MQVQISAVTEERLMHLVESGRYASLEEAVAEAVQHECEESPAPGLEEFLAAAREAVSQGRHSLLSRDVAAEIQREGRARRANALS